MPSASRRNDNRSRVTGIETIQRWYHVPVLALILIYMLAVRLIPYDRFVTDDAVYFSGNDAYYHFRQTSYVVANWPNTMPFEVWSSYPTGTYVGQFGTLFDQSIATAALLVGLGDPTQRQIAIVFVLAPAVLGVLCAIPTYFIGKQLGNRMTGLIAAGVLAILPGVFLSRSVVGFTDHHVAEVFLHSTAVLFFIIALGVAERQKPVYEQFTDRDWAGLWAPLQWSILAGVFLSMYIWVWPPGIVLVGIIGVYFTVRLSIDYFRNRSPEHTAIVGVITLSTVGILTAVTIDQPGISGPTTQNFLHPLLAFGVAIGCLFLAWLARVFEQRQYDPRAYPITVAGLLVIGGLVVSLVLPSVYNMIVSNVFRTIALGQSDTAFTIGEAQSTFSQPVGVSTYFFQSYGFTHLTAVIGLVWLGVRTYSHDENRSQYTFVIIWSIFILLMALTQVRFHYYLAVVIAILNAWLVGRLIQILGIPSITELTNRTSKIGSYQILALVVIVLVIAVPLLVPVGPLSPQEQAERQAPGSVTVWSEGAQWLGDNTPHPGTYGGMDNSMEYYGSYERTENYIYPEGAYGVMSWWDYGHWITVIGERIPHANPFQQGARPASAFFQAQTEERANLLLDALPSMNSPHGASDEELREAIDDQSPEEANERIRYVMIDDEMAAEKFRPITVWTGPGFQSYVDEERFVVAQQNESLPVRGDRYDESMLGRLYVDDANGLEHYRLVHETDQYSIVGSVVALRGGETQIRVFTSIRIGGWEEQAVGISEQLMTARQNNQAAALGGNQYIYDADVLASVKTFERVPGATIQGETESADQVTAIAELEATNTGRTFTYAQTVTPENDGTFAITVPYATEGYLGPDDGYTDTAVRATGNYTVLTGHPLAPNQVGNIDITDTAVVNGETVTVSLESATPPGSPPENETTANETRVSPSLPP